ncbi:hypothetical protein SAMN02982989_1014 [Xaviernesmea oryzae]|uniref:DUF600 family protein n=1 Tax=Xaviernesmea oryzae TaxID=464029 RepID=A0A1X7FWP8_9HYPH|nr:hypothetical protein [Xaviernesmea oryzae]SMF60051.1 hypothetical protein SAMN02982989_1014 [Xaviernesmea oryzae]
MTFDKVRADALIVEIGRMIAADPSYVSRDWIGAALVIEVAPRRRMYGFVYLADGDWEAETPGDFEIIEKAETLSDIMAVEDKRWTRCLVQLTQPGPELKIQFDYGSEDWNVSPSNHVEMVDKLRP